MRGPFLCAVLRCAAAAAIRTNERDCELNQKTPRSIVILSIIFLGISLLLSIPGFFLVSRLLSHSELIITILAVVLVIVSVHIWKAKVRDAEEREKQFVVLLKYFVIVYVPLIFFMTILLILLLLGSTRR